MPNLLSPEVVKEYKEKLCAHRYMTQNNVEKILITTKAKANENKQNRNEYLTVLHFQHFGKLFSVFFNFIV